MRTFKLSELLNQAADWLEKHDLAKYAFLNFDDMSHKDDKVAGHCNQFLLYYEGHKPCKACAIGAIMIQLPLDMFGGLEADAPGLPDKINEIIFLIGKEYQKFFEKNPCRFNCLQSFSDDSDSKEPVIDRLRLFAERTNLEFDECAGLIN